MYWFADVVNNDERNIQLCCRFAQYIQMEIRQIENFQVTVLLCLNARTKFMLC